MISSGAPSFVSRRVVVTGLGIISPLGRTVVSTWDGLVHGRSGVDVITRFDAKQCPTQIAAEVKNFDPLAELKVLEGKIHPKEIRRLPRFVQFSLLASKEAWDDSGLESLGDQLNRDRVGVNIGVGMGGLPELEATHKEYLEKGFRRITPFFIPQVIPNIAAGHVSIYLGARGPNLSLTTACASSAHSIGESLRIIQRSEADVMVAGGAEAVICEMGIGGFAAMRALSTRNDEPTTASRPFEKSRDGFVMGEGSAVLILEERNHAQKRGAKIYAEITGYGSSGDAFHITAPDPEGRGAQRAMQAAVQEARLNWSDIGYVNAHSTSTPMGDEIETFALAKTFGNAKSGLHVSSTKSMMGHLIGAAGAAESLVCVLALQKSIVPPTINLHEIDPAIEEHRLNLTPNQAVEKRIRHALSNSFGFGGTNAALVFSNVDSHSRH